jgi:hypothetical protein
MRPNENKIKEWTVTGGKSKLLLMGNKHNLKYLSER